MTKISIIVPCYNQAQYLSEALQSVLEQTYTNWECIIVNDGSPDNTEAVAGEWITKDTRFKYIYQVNCGLSSARNAGLDFATGDYIQFLDADDLLEKEKIKMQMVELLQDDEIDVSVSGYRYFDDKTTTLKSMGNNNFFPEVVLSKNDTDLIDVLKVKNPMVISASIYRKCVFEKVGFFDEELISLEDWDFHTRCALHNIRFHHVGNICKTRTLIRLHPNSMMQNTELMNKGYQLFLTKRKNNEMFVKQFPYEDIIYKRKSLNSLKKIIKLFIPPILVLLKRKLFILRNGSK